jgi:PST family polysaccharide transporter
MGLFVGAMAPVLAWFYGEPPLMAMTFVMALGIVGLNVMAQHESLLTRQMRFGALALIDIGSLVAGVTVGIVAALSGLGYWALVLQSVAMHLTRSALVWGASRWRPIRPGALGDQQREGVRAMLNYGVGYSGAKLLNHASRNIDRVLVGFFHGSTAVGLYDNAYRWSIFPLQQLYKPLKTVAVSGLSRVQNQPATFRAYFRSAFRLVLTACMPIIAFIFVETRDVVLVLLGDQWLGAVPILRILCVNAFFRALGKVTPWIYLAQGETGRQFRWSLLHAPLLVGAVVVGVPWGPMGVALGFTAATALLTVPEVAYCLRVSHLTGRDLWQSLWRPLVASVGGGLAAFAFDTSALTDAGLLLDVFAEGGVFSLTYALLWIGLPGGWTALRNLLRLARSLRRSRRDKSEPDLRGRSSSSGSPPRADAPQPELDKHI